jgi:two-component system response regulator NreC
VEPIRVVLADEHAVVRSGLRLLLEAEEGVMVVAEAGEIDTTRRMVAAQRPDVLVLALNMPGRKGGPI